MPGHYEFIMAGHFFINSKLLKTANVSFNDKKHGMILVIES